MDSMQLLIVFLLSTAIGLLIRQMWVLEQNFMSHTDFVDNKISEIEARLDKIEFFGSTVQEIMDVDLQRVLKYHQFEIDLLKHGFETHNQSVFHMDEQYQLTKVTPVLEDTIKLAELETNILKAAKELGIEYSLKSNRPRGLD